jgi:hypothetical protein
LSWAEAGEVEAKRAADSAVADINFQFIGNSFEFVLGSASLNNSGLNEPTRSAKAEC